MSRVNKKEKEKEQRKALQSGEERFIYPKYNLRAR